MMNDSESKIIGECRQVEMVSVAGLIIDDGKGKEDYQRGRRSTFPSWNWDMYDPIHVADRNGSGRHVVDGGQRTREARRFGIKELPAYVAKSDGVEEEAKLFIRFAKNRSNLSARDKYKAAVVAGDEAAVALRDVLSNYGLHVGDSANWPSVRSVTSLLKLSWQAVDFSCGVITSIWYGNSAALLEPSIVGLAIFWTQNDGKIDASRLKKKLIKLDPTVITQRASAMATVSRSAHRRTIYGEVFQEIYNKRGYR